MGMARSVYLGYGQKTRKALAVSGHDIVVLMRASQSTVLQGEDARIFLREISEITNHMCGTRRSTRVEEIAKRIGRSDAESIYAEVFDKYHVHA